MATRFVLAAADQPIAGLPLQAPVRKREKENRVVSFDHPFALWAMTDVAQSASNSKRDIQAQSWDAHARLGSKGNLGKWVKLRSGDAFAESPFDPA